MFFMYYRWLHFKLGSLIIVIVTWFRRLLLLDQRCEPDQFRQIARFLCCLHFKLSDSEFALYSSFD